MDDHHFNYITKLKKKNPNFMFKLLVERKNWILSFEIQKQKISK
jgi:hypothetical protein